MALRKYRVDIGLQSRQPAPLSNVICFQHLIAEQQRKLDGRPRQPSLENAVVRRISRDQSRKIILQYEWLKTMGRAVVCYGLFIKDELLGAVNFGWPAGIESRHICGREFSHLAVCLERGACVHWAPRNSASFLISRATKYASHDFGWRIFYAYADEDAGEIGCVYQACNWLYLGRGVGRDPGRLREDFVTPDGERITGRAMRRRRLRKSTVIRMGWKVVYSNPKHKYVFFAGTQTEKTFFKQLCRYPVRPYPKRIVGTTELSVPLVRMQPYV